jgi:hypothetical protein
MGPKTIAAWHRFNQDGETDISQESHALQLTALASVTPGKDDVRAIRARNENGRFQSQPERWDFGAENKINTGGSSIRLHSDKGFPGNFRSADSNGPETAAPALTSRKRPASGPSKNNSSTLNGDDHSAVSHLAGISEFADAIARYQRNTRIDINSSTLADRTVKLRRDS